MEKEIKKKHKRAVLSKVELIALQACMAEVEKARQQLLVVQKEIGLDPNKNYSISEGGEVTEIKEVAGDASKD